MKHFTLLLLFTLFGSCVFAGDSLNVVGVDGKREGPWIIYGRMQKDKSFAADAKVEEGRYKNGLKIGTWIFYFPSGKKKQQFTYVNNRPNGPAVFYNEQGIKTEEGTWVGTRWVGDYQLFYEDGTPRQKFNYNTVGQRDGKQEMYHANGKLMYELNLKNGKEEGWQREYDENGNLVKETFFNNGVIDNTKTKTYASTAKKSTLADEDKVKPEPPPPAPPLPPGTKWNGNGPYTLMKGGQVSQKGTFSNFKLIDGEARFYDNNGFLIQIKLYKAGKYVGDAPIPADANK